MFLRTLTLKGFKSFAESTKLEFEPGLNVVVGPNGSGKSNIVDAVAWVLGAQGPRAVRSARMDDVIFAGTNRKTALGRAEVSLTIDNSSGLLDIDLSEVTITRTLFRASGESEYALNGAPCRLLDVQELLSDSGVGRQQHVIVSQGNLDAVLDARPEDRRLIIEEAAGILKFRRRKEKAERRLEGTEANLVRLTDLLREVGRQLRPLERQAEAARRHGSVVEELAALQLYLKGRELAALGARSQASAAARDTLAAEEVRVRTVLNDLDEAMIREESSLAAAGGSALVDTVGRLESLRERARGLAALLAERRRSAEGSVHAAPDAALVAKLHADADVVALEINAVDAEIVALEEPAAALADAEATLSVQRTAQVEMEPRTERAAEARGELAARTANLERSTQEFLRLEVRAGELAVTLSDLTVENSMAAEQLAGAVTAETEATGRSDKCRAESQAATIRAAACSARARSASDEHRSWVARATALAEVVGPAGAPSGADAAAGSSGGTAPGVVGALLDRIELEPGHEAALEAALAGALDMIVVDDVAGLAAIVAATASADELPENILVLGAVKNAGRPEAVKATGWRPMGDVVRSSYSALQDALDVLFAFTVLADDWRAAVTAVAAHPGVTAVTLAGGRFDAAGWRLGAGRSGETRAALALARTEVEQAAVALGVAEAKAAEVTADLAEKSAAATEADRGAKAATAHRLELEQADLRRERDLERAGAELADAQVVIARYQTARSDDAARVAELERTLPALELQEAESAQRAAAAAAVRLRLEERGDELAGRRAEFEARSAELDERRRQLARRLHEVNEHLADVAAADQANEQRRAGLDQLLVHIDLVASFLASRLAEIEIHLTDVRERRDRHTRAVAEAAQRLDAVRARRHDEARRLEEIRERLRRVELEAAEARMRREAAVEAVRRELESEPEVAIAAECPSIPAGSSPTSRARELERDLRLMGQVNPLAFEELAALQERHAFLAAQLDDVKGSRRELARVIRAVEAEMAELLAAAYADVEEHFAKLFETLFPGGKGRLALTDPEHLLESGIEVDARPAGKNVRKLSLLSGGERSLVALAFLFAVFRSRPSPFYLLDEVEAALDDLNLHRFVDLLDEFRSEAQLLIVTHQKRTMEAADCLYGVTMQPGGSSRVISERARASA